MKRLIPFFSVLLTIAVVLAAAAAFLPWKPWLENRIILVLKEKGFSDASLSIASVGSKGIVLKDLNLGGDTPLILKNVTVDYSLQDLKAHKAEGITLSGFVLEAARGKDGRWSITGLENFLSGGEKKSQLALPMTQDRVSGIPFEKITVEDTMLTLTTPAWQAQIHVHLQLEKSPIPHIMLESSSVSVRKGEMDIVTGPLQAKISLAEIDRQWTGKWTVQAVNITGTPTTVPPLSGEGKITAKENQILTEGRLQSSDKAYHVSFSHNLALNPSQTSSLTVTSAAMPWKEGRLSVGTVKIPLSGRQSVPVRLNIENVSIDELVGAITGQRISATGTVSGEVPLTIASDGTLIFRGGTLNAAGPGTIMMPPEIIPGDNEQIALVREIMMDLRYTRLSIGLNSDENKALSILMSLEGSNPSVYNGREVKLNINLTGDLLDFVKQNLIFLSNPQSLLEAGNNAEN